MQSLRRVESEVSLTGMILANTKIPKSKSMVSLPQALASTIERFSCSQSQLANQQYLQANTQGFHDLVERGDHGILVERCMRRGSSSSEMAIYDKNYQSLPSSHRSLWPRKQWASERESHHTASTRESFSNDTILHDLVERGDHGILVERCMRRGSSSSEMAIYDKNNQSSSSSHRSLWPRKQGASERESHHTASTRESFSNDTCDSKTMKKERSQMTRKTHIRRIDSINSHLQGGPIPKWIYVEINQSYCSSSLTRPTTQDSSGVLLDQTPSKIVTQHADLIPLSELAMMMSQDLIGAIEKGLFYSRDLSKNDHGDQQVRENMGECDRQC
jgi:uncharacterized protein YgiB involved in biofilm formation